MSARKSENGGASELRSGLERAASESVEGGARVAPDVAMKQIEARQLSVLERIGNIGSTFASRLTEAAKFAGKDIMDAPGTLMRALRRVGGTVGEGMEIAAITGLAGGATTVETAIGGIRGVSETALGAAEVGVDAVKGAAGVTAAVGEGMGNLMERGVRAGIKVGEMTGDVMEKTVRGAGRLAKKGIDAAARDIADAPATAKRAGQRALDTGLNAAEFTGRFAGASAMLAPEIIAGGALAVAESAKGGAEIARDATLGAALVVGKGMGSVMEKTVRRGAKFAKTVGETVGEGMEIAAKTGLEVGLIVPNTAIGGTRAVVETARGAAEITKDATLAVGELTGNAMEGAVRDVLDAPATAKRAVENTIAWLDALASGVTNKKEKAELVKVRGIMRDTERTTERVTADAERALARAEKELLDEMSDMEGAANLLPLLRKLFDSSIGDQEHRAVQKAIDVMLAKAPEPVRKAYDNHLVGVAYISEVFGNEIMKIEMGLANAEPEVAAFADKFFAVTRRESLSADGQEAAAK